MGRVSRGKRAAADEIADGLHAAAIYLLRRLRKQDAAAGIGPARLSALSVVVFGGPLALGELAAAEQVRPATMSRIVAGLVRRGLVKRAASPDDGRVARLSATPKGNRLLQRARRRRIHYLARRLRRLAPGERAVLGRAASLIERLLPA